MPSGSFTAGAVIKKTIRGNPYDALIQAESSLKGYFRLDEATGSTIKDMTGNSTGISSTVLRSQDGLIGGDTDKAVGFDGTDIYINGANSTLPVGSNAAFTIEFIVKLGAASDNYFLVGFSESVLRVRALIRFNGHIYFWGDGNDFDSGVDYGTSTVHIAATYNGTTLRIYKNGAEVNNTNKNFTASSNTNFAIGRKGFLGASFMSALPNNTTMDEVAFYNTALSPTTILTHYLASLGSLQADAIFRRNQTASFTTDAVIKRTAFTVDAILKKSQSGSFTGNAFFNDFFTADAILKKSQSAAATANSITRRSQAASLTADATIATLVLGSFTANAITKKAQSATLTGNAIVRRGQLGSFTADAYITGTTYQFSFTANAVLREPALSGSFTANAYIVTGNRWRHHRTRDHFGAEDTLYVVLADDIGPWLSGTPIQFVLEDLASRLYSLETATRRNFSFTADAYILAPGSVINGHSAFFADSVLKRKMTSSFLANAHIDRKFTFTANAYIARAFTANAVII